MRDCGISEEESLASTACGDELVMEHISNAMAASISYNTINEAFHRSQVRELVDLEQEEDF